MVGEWVEVNIHNVQHCYFYELLIEPLENEFAICENAVSPRLRAMLC